MRAEDPKASSFDRLLEQLPEGVPLGLFERKRLEVVLRAAGMPEEGQALAAWMAGDPSRIGRLVAAVVGKESGHREAIEAAVAGWWEQERRRVVVPVPVDASTGATPVAEVSEVEPERRAWWWIGLVGVMVVMGVGWVVWKPGLDVQEIATTGGGIEGSGSGDGGSGVHASGGDDPSSDSGTGDEGTTTTTGGEDEGGPDLTALRVRVPVAKLTGPHEVEGEPAAIPWPPLAVAVLALAALVALLRAKAPIGPADPPTGLPPRLAHVPERTAWGRVPPRGRPLRHVLLERGDRDVLVGGVARELSDRLTEELDVPRSIDLTIETEVPSLSFLAASDSRGVWIWRDTDMAEHGDLAEQLERELVVAMRDAGLPAEQAVFVGVPSTLEVGRRKLASALLLGVGRPPRVAVLTDGDRLHRRLRDDSTRASTEALLRMLRRWEGLAVVDFGDERSSLAVLAQQWHLRRISPAQAAAHLAGQAPREGLVSSSRDRLKWEVACAIAPRAIDEAEAQRLRRALKLRASPFEVEQLGASRRRHGRLEWSARARAEVLGRYDRAHGYVSTWPSGGAELVRAAVRCWRELYAQAIADKGAEDRSDTKAHLEIERAVLGLWGEPDDPGTGDPDEHAAEATTLVTKAAEVLYARWQDDALRDAVEELVSQHTDAHGPSERVRLPWMLEKLPERTRWMLEQMGLELGSRVPQTGQQEVVLPRSGRWSLGVGVAAGVSVGAMGLGVVEWTRAEEERLRTRVEVVVLGRGPVGASVECGVEEGTLACEVQSRHWVERVVLGPLGPREGIVRVEVSWAIEERACEGAWGEGGLYVICDRKGRLWRQELGVEEWSRAVVGSGAEDRLIAQALLDSGSADVVMMREVRAEARRALAGDGQRIVILAEGGEEALDWSGLVVRVPEGSLPSLDFVGTKDVREVWPEAEVVQGEGERFELRGVLTPNCPAGMVYIAGGEFEAKDIEGFCLDVTEVTVAAYGDCIWGLHFWRRLFRCG